jgi:hypothetical protein
MHVFTYVYDADVTLLFIQLCTMDDIVIRVRRCGRRI